MVYLGARFFLSAIYLSTRASYLMAGKCCEADSTCSGCWMCTGSDLRTCWDSAVSEADACSNEEDLSKQVECLCASYGKIAFCWSKGRCCTEYAPTLSAATNLCNLKTYPADHLTKDLVEQAANDAYNVRNTIWHNDSGYDVPKLSVYVKAYSTTNSQATSSNKSSASYKARSQTETSGSQSSAPNEPSTAAPEEAQGQEQGQYVSKGKKPKTSPNKAHQQGKCLRQQHKRKHRKSKLDASSQSFSKNAEIWKRSESLDSRGLSQPNCGIDFHGVAYPSQVPETVSQVFATL